MLRPDRRPQGARRTDPLVYGRELDGESFLVAVNPAARERRIEIAAEQDADPKPIIGAGDIEIARENGKLKIAMSGVSAGVFRLR